MHDVTAHGSGSLLASVDHIIYATPDLNRGIDEIEGLVAVRASPGGQHLGLGTRNALVALGPTTYLEIFAPDPDQPPPRKPRPFGLDDLKESKLIAWFVRGTDLLRLREEAVRKGVPLGEIRSGSRQRPDGTELSWQFTDPWRLVADGVIPFFIDWGGSQHPAGNAAKGALLAGLRAEHPNAETVRGMLQQLDLALPVTESSDPALIAVIEGPRGRVELR